MCDPRHIMFCAVTVVNHWLLLALGWARRAWRLSAVRHLVALYVVTFAVVLPIVCHDLHHSVYFREWTTEVEGKKLLREENNQRLAEAVKYLQYYNQSKSQPLWRTNQDGRPVDVAITIVTVSRNRHMVDSYEPRYLTQVVSRFVELSQDPELHTYPLTINMSVCNVDQDPDSYHEASALTWVMPSVRRYSRRTLSMVHAKEKEKQDYVFCLKAALQHNPR